jgi:hypothetical protein
VSARSAITPLVLVVAHICAYKCWVWR